jgi:hypothetical protein
MLCEGMEYKYILPKDLMQESVEIINKISGKKKRMH